jgi:methylated-DNA-protein-cysteine methyltransferase-like protein
MSPFKEKVIQIIRLVPYGKVVSYGQVAAYAGMPRAAREVGWILNGTNEFAEVPWWRVVNNKGFLSIRGNQTADKELQKKLLQAEGIVVSDDFEIDMEVYRYRMSLEQLQKLQLSEEYIENLMAKYSL